MELTMEKPRASGEAKAALSSSAPHSSSAVVTAPRPSDSHQFSVQAHRSISVAGPLPASLDAGVLLHGALRPGTLSAHPAGAERHHHSGSAYHAASPFQGAHGAFYPQTHPALGMMAKPDAARTSSVTARSKVGTDRPRLVPPPPYLLTNFVVAVACKLGELRSCIDGALRTSNVDYAYKEDKWKAKCCLYRPKGFCAFVMRAFTEQGANGETFLLELQRRKGCHNLFQSTYDKVIAHLATTGVLAPGCSASARANFLAQASSSAAAAPPSGAPFSLLVPPPQPHLPSPAPSSASAKRPLGAAAPERSISTASWASTPFDAAVDDDDVAAISLPPHLLASADVAEALRATDTAAFVDAFIGLDAMLSSPFDDVACSAAQSIAALAVSKRVRRALGKKALRAYAHSLERFQQAQRATSSASAASLDSPRRQSSAGSSSSAASNATAPLTATTHSSAAAVAGAAALLPAARKSSGAGATLASPIASPGGTAAAAAAPRPHSPQVPHSPTAPNGVTSDDIAALHIFAMLLLYVERSPQAVQSANAGIECRSAAAIALALLAEDESCAEVLLRYAAPTRLLAVPSLPETSLPHEHAALRREALRTVSLLVRLPAAASYTPREAVAQCGAALRRMQPTQSDGVYDALLASVVSGVEHLAMEVGSPRSGSGTPVKQ